MHLDTHFHPTPALSPQGRGRNIWQSKARSPFSEVQTWPQRAPSPRGEGEPFGSRRTRSRASEISEPVQECSLSWAGTIQLHFAQLAAKPRVQQVGRLYVVANSLTKRYGCRET